MRSLTPLTRLASRGLILLPAALCLALSVGACRRLADPSGLLRWVEQERLRQQELEASRQALSDRVASRQQVARDLLERRLGWGDALARWRRLESDAAGQPPGARRGGAGKEDEDERLGRAILLWVADLLADRPHDAGEVLARLERELRQHPGRLRAARRSR